MSSPTNRNLPHVSHPIWESVRNNRAHLLEGSCVSIDPSSGSKTSSPGYALFIKGELVRGGEIPLDEEFKGSGIAYLPQRLKILGRNLRTHVGPVDLLIVENIRPEMNERTVLGSYYALVTSVGMIYSALDWKYIIRLHPDLWKKYAGEKHRKSDPLDAEVMGRLLIEMARTLG